MTVCVVEDCTLPARSARADLCPKHYHRWYRHGSPELSARTSGISVSPGRRYRSVKAPGHPLASPLGIVYEHRKVLFDKIGPGKHPCHWCGAELDWDVAHVQPGALQVDHLDNVGDNNDPANLVPVCRSCNTTRGQQRRSDALRRAGWWSGADTVGTRRAPLPRGGDEDAA